MLAIFGDTPENFSKVPLKNGLKFRKKGTVLMVMKWKGNGCYLIGESWVRFFPLKQEIDIYTLTRSDCKSGTLYHCMSITYLLLRILILAVLGMDLP